MTLTAIVTANAVGATFTAPGGLVGVVTAVEGKTDEVHAVPHSGDDVVFPSGSTPPFLGAGRVLFTSCWGDPGWAEVFGNSCIVGHDDGTRALYAHFASLLVKVGDVVIVGQPIGVQGSTGLSTGDHVHIGYALDSNPWFNKDADGGTSRLLDPLEHLLAETAVVAAAAPDAYAIAAHQAAYLADNTARLRNALQERAPKFILDELIATGARLQAAIEASIALL